MIAFSYRSFRNHLESTLEKTESRFLIRTFGYASAYFFLLGALAFLFHLLLFELIFTLSYASCACMGLGGFLLCFPLHFFSLKYRNNPLRVPSSFVNVCFALLTFTFILMFLALTGTIALLCNEGTVSTSVARQFVGGAILAIMVSSSIVYTVPAVFAWLIQGKKRTITLNKFLNTCYLVYLVLFGITITSLCLGFGISGFLRIFGLIILCAMIFCGPVLTIYRLKTVAYYINHDDNFERKRWENYFAFEIAFQLLKIAFCVLKVLVLIIWRTKTRLK